MSRAKIAREQGFLPGTPVPTNARGGRRVQIYKRELMREILDELAEGKTLREVCQRGGMPTPTTVYKWLQAHEEDFKEFEQVKIIKSHALFDEALDLCRVLSANWGKTVSAQQVNALRTSINTLMEAAGKLNPRDYGQRKAGDVVVPVQIVTNMNLGQEGAPKIIEGTNVYEISVPIRVPDNET